MTTKLLYGELRSGKITGEIPVLDAEWQEILNGPGSISARVHESVVRRLNLREDADAARCFLAVEQDDRIREAGPIWVHNWDDERGVLSLAAGGLWSIFDHRYVLQVLVDNMRVNDSLVTVSNTDLGGIARALVALAMMHLGGDLPVVLPVVLPGTHTETFEGWRLLRVGEQLRQITQRETGAPDIRFTPRRNPNDRRFLQWVMETGTEEQPQLAQIGADWIFDKTTRTSKVKNVSVKRDATVMGVRGFGVGFGSEKATLIVYDSNDALLDRGFPLLEVVESRTSVEEAPTLLGHTRNLVQRVARPIELVTVTVHASATLEVRSGHYCRLRTRDHAYLPNGERRMRIRSLAGKTSDVVSLEMYEMATLL